MCDDSSGLVNGFEESATDTSACDCHSAGKSVLCVFGDAMMVNEAEFLVVVDEEDDLEYEEKVLSYEFGVEPNCVSGCTEFEDDVSDETDMINN